MLKFELEFEFEFEFTFAYLGAGNVDVGNELCQKYLDSMSCKCNNIQVHRCLLGSWYCCCRQ